MDSVLTSTPPWREGTPPLGQILLQRGLITQAQLDEALSLQPAWGSRVGRILLGKGCITAQQLYAALAEHYGLPFANLMDQPPDDSLLCAADRQDYLDLGLLPWRRGADGRVILATTGLDQPVMDWATARFGADGLEFVITSSFDITWQVQRHFDTEDDHDARDRLWELSPMDSARLTMTGRQKLLLSALVVGLVGGLCLTPVATAMVLCLVINGFYLATFLLKLVLTWVGADRRVDVQVTQRELRELDDAQLPEYTVLVPLYREADVLPGLVDSLRNLDYPMSKLDVKLILESDDVETIEAAKALACESIFEIIRVPSSLPKTKPKACNYALRYARGEIITIYDAEDRPEPDQLKKVIIAFRKSTPNTCCIQARLNYYNMDENFLTKSFTLEYSQWFDFLLPGLDTLRIPIPLGGTSNHINLKVLRELGAWDPYNVTEDADLGVRMTKAGYRVGVVNSTTFEEANSRLGNWLRQRSRWLKGYMQTYLVHMRRPVRLYRSLGGVGFWGFQLFIGGPAMVAAINPLMWALFVLWLFARHGFIGVLFPPEVMCIALVNLLFGNLMYIYFGIVALFKRGYQRILPFAILQPAYWALHSVAVYKGIGQLLINPHFWEKTVHGLSKLARNVVGGGQDDGDVPHDGALLAADWNRADPDRPRGEGDGLFGKVVFLALWAVLAAAALFSSHIPSVHAAEETLADHITGSAAAVVDPLIHTLGAFFPLLLLDSLRALLRMDAGALGAVTALTAAGALAIAARSAVRHGFAAWEAVLLIVCIAAHPLVLFSAVSGGWLLVPAVVFLMIMLWVYRVEYIGDVQSRMTLGIALGVATLSDPNTIYVTLPLAAFLPWIDRESRTAAGVLAAWTLMLMPALIAVFSYFLGIEILFGLSPEDLIGQWLKPWHGVPWLVGAPQPSLHGHLLSFPQPPEYVTALVLVMAPLMIVPLVHGVLHRDERHAPRTALLSVVLPLIAGLLCARFTHLGDARSVMLMLTFGSLAWLSKANVARSMRLVAIFALAASSIGAWLSPVLWQEPVISAWRDTLWHALRAAVQVWAPSLAA